MKKRVITGMMTASVIVSLAGCGAGQKETVESTAPATMTETVAASQVETAEVTETETTVQLASTEYFPSGAMEPTGHPRRATILSNTA